MEKDDGIVEMMQAYAEQFDKLCQERHELGQLEYGEFTFLENDVVRMMAEELADTSNYCRMQFIKLMMLNNLLVEDINAKGLAGGAEEASIGIRAFKGTKDGWEKK